MSEPKPATATATAKGIPADLIPTREACRLAGVAMSSLWRWILRGRLSAWRRAGRAFVSRAELQGMFERIVPVPDSQKPAPPTAAELRRRKAYTDKMLKKFGVTK